ILNSSVCDENAGFPHDNRLTGVQGEFGRNDLKIGHGWRGGPNALTLRIDNLRAAHPERPGRDRDRFVAHVSQLDRRRDLPADGNVASVSDGHARLQTTDLLAPGGEVLLRVLLWFLVPVQARQ